MLNVLNITKPNNIDDIDKILFTFNKGKFANYYCENIVTFDIETTTAYKVGDEAIPFDHEKYNSDEAYREMIDNSTPISIMYCWQMAVSSADGNIYVFFGREWIDFHRTLRRLTREAKRQMCFGPVAKDREQETLIACVINNNTLNLKIFIHNAGFEFQHLRNLYEDKFTADRKQRVFARSSRKPMKVDFLLDKKIRIEIRDTLVLTQKSLKNWCKDENLPVMKCEPIDYLQIRHPETPLTDEEIQYCINDVVSMVYGIDKFKEKFGSINNIPLTQTGIVRRKVCTETFQRDKDWCVEQCQIMKNYDYDFFKKLCKLFQGGWTHANATKVNKIYEDVRAFDFASSYPSVMTNARMPVSEFKECDKSEFDALASQDLETADYRWFAKVKIYNQNSIVMSKLQNTYWSTSKCEEIEGTPIIDNGRLKACQSFTAYVTDLDYDIIKNTYIYSDVEVLELYKAKAGYLSTALIGLILEYFGYKTSLKGTDNESLYVESKQFVNSIYGCFVTRIASDIIEFNDKIGWDKVKFDDESGPQILFDVLQSLTPEKCFGSFQLGIWVTAWARHRLWDFIIHFDEKIIYCDTDSIKGLFDDEDLKWIDDYNASIASLEDRVATLLGFDSKLYTPLTSKGKMKRLGVMEREDDAAYFKTLGAKRYVYETKDGEMHTTIAGLPKSAGVNKIHKCEDFTNETIWNTMESQKNTAVYNDDQPNAILTDLYGNKYEACDKYGIAIVPTTFDLSISEEFAKFLMTLKRGAIDDNDEFFSDVPYVLR